MDVEYPDYNPDGKKLTHKQHMEKKRKYEEEQAKKRARTDGRPPGRCPKCEGGRFVLRCDKGSMIRTCKNVKCRDEVIFR